jgi:D-alanyl-D-alanine carboxypeptidase
MNASSLEQKLSFRNKIVSRVEKFNRKHRRLSFLGLAYAVAAITGYNFLFYCYRNTKRFTCLACILLFFVASSSFSYPAMSLNISFASSSDTEGIQDAEAEQLSGEAVAESDAVLVTAQDVDSEVLLEASEVVNPDAAEVEDMASLSEILETTEEAGFDYTEIPDAEIAAGSEPDSGADSISFDRDDWKIVLVNKQHPIPDGYEFNLGTISGGLQCDERVIAPLRDMLKAARDDGISLIICSPYRDIDRQTMLFNNKVDHYMGGGMSYMDAYNLASQAVTVPGSSEHQIGMALDIVTSDYSSLDEGFGETPAGKWLAANSYKYGFILRYPQGKEEITSIEYEPWHFRYVGVEAATVIAENGICLEEFWNRYVQ